MDILQFAEVPEGTSQIEERNPQGMDHYQMHALLRSEEARQEQYKQELDTLAEGKGFNLRGHAARTWKQESLVNAAADVAVDLSQRHDWSYDPAEDMKTLPADWPQAYKDRMMDAQNAEHFQKLRERYQDQIDYNREAEYLGGAGTAVRIASMLAHPENIVLGAGEAAALSKIGMKTAIGKFAAGASIGALSNTGQELALIANNPSREKIGAAIAFGTGAALGGAFSVFAKTAPAIDAVLAAKSMVGKAYARATGKDLDHAVSKSLYEGTDDVSTMYRGMLEGRLVKDPASGKWYVGVGQTAVEATDRADALKRYRLVEDSGFYGRKPAAADTDGVQVPGGQTTPTETVVDEITPPGFTLDDTGRIDADIPKIKSYTGPLKSIGAEGMASANPWERFLTWRTMEFAPGTGGKKVAEQSAALSADMYAHQLRSTWHPERLKAIKSWARENKVKAMPWDEGAGAHFDREVFTELHYRKYPGHRPDGHVTNKEVSRMADLYQDVEVGMFKMQKDANVYGYGAIEPDRLHTRNTWDATRLNRMTQLKGKDFVISLIKRGILESGEFARTAKYAKIGNKLTKEFMDDRAGYMAKAVYERYMRRPNTASLAMSSYIRTADRKILEKRLEEAVADPNTLTHIMSSIDGKDSRLIHEYMNQIEVNLNASVDGMKLMDLMDLDLGRNMDSRFRKAAGQTAMAKKGFRDESAFHDIVEVAGQWYQKNTKKTENEIIAETNRMRKLWRVVMGQNLEEAPESGTARTMRGLRRAASLASMNQVGFAQLAEFGRVTGSLGVRNFMQQIPALKNMRRAMLNGEFNDPMLRDIEAAFSIRLGDNHLLHHPLIMADSGGYGISKGGSNAFLKGLDTISMKGLHVQGYINGMNMITRLQQRMHARGFFMRMYDDVMAGQRAGRYRDLGLSDTDLLSVRKEFEKNATTTKGWFGQDRLENANLAAFDPAVSEKLALAFHKAQSQAIQRNIGGELGWFFHGTFGKMLSQFRTFPIVALEKQTIHDLKFMDIESFTTLATSFGMATLAYMGKSYANSFGIPKHKRKQYMKNRIGTPAKIAAGAMGWMGQAAIMPDVFDSVLGATNLDNPFRYTDYKGSRFRQYNSGLSIDQLGPGAAYLNNAYRFATGAHAAVMNGEELRDDVLKRGSRLLPFSNALGIINISNSLGD